MCYVFDRWSLKNFVIVHDKDMCRIQRPTVLPNHFKFDGHSSTLEVFCLILALAGQISTNASTKDHKTYP